MKQTILKNIRKHQKTTGKVPTIVDLLTMPGAGSIEFEPQPLSGELWRPVLNLPKVKAG